MIVQEMKSRHTKEVNKLGGMLYDRSGYRMDVNLWFRHKNEALFYLNSVGKVHGPMDQTYSIRLGPIEKSGKEISFKREFLEEKEKDNWKYCNEIQNSNPIQFVEEMKHFETILQDVSSNKSNNCKRCFLTTATHFIPKYTTNIEIGGYSTTLTKQHTKTRQGVTVNLTALVETIDETSIRERRLIDELLETRNELNTLKGTKSVIDTNVIKDNSQNYYDEAFVSKIITDVQPSTRSVRTRYSSSRQESVSKGLPKVSQISSIQKSKNFVECQSVNSDVLNRSILDEMRQQQKLDKPNLLSIPVTFSTSSSNKASEFSNNNSMNQTVSMKEERVNSVLPVQSIERSFTSADDDEHDHHHEEKTVTIKRKITRRKKLSENVSHLRDSYIDKISTPLPNYETASDTDEDKINCINSQTMSPISEIIPLKQASTFEEPLSISELSKINEDIIIPKKKDNDASGLLASTLSNPKKIEKQTTEYNRGPDWEFRDTTSQRVKPRQHLSNRHLSEERSQQMAPISTYSARKENMKSQQMLDERNLESRNLQAEKNIGQRNEMTEEIETITLQPIGKGVQDLAASLGVTINRSNSRAATPRAFESGTAKIRNNNYYREESRQIGNYNTMPINPKFAKTNSQISNYDLADNNKRGLSAHRVGNEQNQTTSFNRFSNEQSNASFNKVSINEQSRNASLSKVGTNGHTWNLSGDRGGNEQTLHKSWHTRTESYSGGNRDVQLLVSPLSNQESISSNIIVTSAVDDQRYNLQMVLNSEEQWYQPHYSRDDVINDLRDKEPGSFLIRNSSTFAGSYGLALKVISLPDNAVRTNDTQGDLVRHFLIEIVEETSNSGVRLKGFTNELVYPSLAHLVQAHCQNAIALPNRLVLPQTSFLKMDHKDGITAKSQYQYESHQNQQQIGSSKAQILSRSMSSPGVNFFAINHPNPLHQCFTIGAMYLGKIEIDRLTGDAAIEHAVDKIMTKSALKTSTVEVQLDSTKGITLNDKMQKLFYTRQFPAQRVLYAGFDPKHREFASPLLQNNGINRGRIIGIVVKKEKMILRENAVHLFCEIDDKNNINDVIIFINENYLRRV